MSVESMASSRQGRKGRRRESRARMDESVSVARSRQGRKGTPKGEPGEDSGPGRPLPAAKDDKDKVVAFNRLLSLGERIL